MKPLDRPAPDSEAAPENQKHHAKCHSGKPSGTRDANLAVTEKCENTAPGDEWLTDIMQPVRRCQKGNELPREHLSHDP